MVACLFTIQLSGWTFDLVTCLCLEIIRVDDDQPHPIRARADRRGVIRSEIFGAERIEVGGLVTHRAAKLCLEAPLDRGRSVRFDRAFDLDRQDRTGTTGNTDRLGIYVYSDIGDRSLRLLDDRNSCKVAARIHHTGGDPASLTGILRVCDVPPTPIRTFADDLRGLPNNQRADS